MNISLSWEIFLKLANFIFDILSFNWNFYDFQNKWPQMGRLCGQMKLLNYKFFYFFGTSKTYLSRPIIIFWYLNYSWRNTLCNLILHKCHHLFFIFQYWKFFFIPPWKEKTPKKKGEFVFLKGFTADFYRNYFFL